MFVFLFLSCQVLRTKVFLPQSNPGQGSGTNTGDRRSEGERRRREQQQQQEKKCRKIFVGREAKLCQELPKDKGGDRHGPWATDV